MPSPPRHEARVVALGDRAHVRVVTVEVVCDSTVARRMNALFMAVIIHTLVLSNRKADRCHKQRHELLPTQSDEYQLPPCNPGALRLL